MNNRFLEVEIDNRKKTRRLIQIDQIVQIQGRDLGESDITIIDIKDDGGISTKESYEQIKKRIMENRPFLPFKINTGLSNYQEDFSNILRKIEKMYNIAEGELDIFLLGGEEWKF